MSYHRKMMTGIELADPKNLEDLVSGRTNAFIALREGWASKEAIGRIKTELEKTQTLFSDYPKDAVLRIKNDGTAEYVELLGYLRDRNNALTFDTQGAITKRSGGMAYFLTAELRLHNRMPWRKAAMARYATIRTRLTSLIEENKADLDTRTGGIEVYLEGSEGLALIHKKQVAPVQIEGNEKFLTGPNVTILQLLAYYLRANALASYAQSSPARATPVVITPAI